MQVVHSLYGLELQKGVPDETAVSLFLANGAGSFANFGTELNTKFQGFFARLGGNLFKLVECIKPALPSRMIAIENAAHEAIFRHDAFTESFFLPLNRNCLVYELDRELPVAFFFDIMAENDFREWGRNYKLSCRDGIFVIAFAKQTDGREDKTNRKAEYMVYAAIKSDCYIQPGSVLNAGEWVKRDYSLDTARHSLSSRHVYKVATIAGKIFTIAVAKSEAAAVREASAVFSSIGKLKAEAVSHYRSLLNQQPAKKIGAERILAELMARVALDKLLTKSGMYAGLPWFFQRWSRDELVSCSALAPWQRRKLVLFYLDKLMPDGFLPAMLESPSHGCADAAGWLFFRASELYNENLLTKAEILKVKVSLKRCIDSLLKSHLSSAFVTNGKNQTWMDTSWNDDGREGACIEVQALQLAMYSFMYELGRDETYRKLEDSLMANVRQMFWNGRVLADRLNDFTLRPNIFIAAYVYPGLLSKAEWSACFEAALESLWLGWGGLATIARGHPNFHGRYTGETNESYHRGDSWYWINNIAAIVMSKINKNKFKHYIEKIFAASANDILWEGAVGCGSELSSAKEQKAEGCLNQAWSNATYIELVEELGR